MRALHRTLIFNSSNQCDYACFAENPERKARGILEQLDQVQLSLPYPAIITGG